MTPTIIDEWHSATHGYFRIILASTNVLVVEQKQKNILGEVYWGVPPQPQQTIMALAKRILSFRNTLTSPTSQPNQPIDTTEALTNILARLHEVLDDHTKQKKTK